MGRQAWSSARRQANAAENIVVYWKEIMKGTDHILFLAEVAAGVILGFVVWSYVAPMITSTVATPAA